MMLISKRWSFLFLLPLILAASFIFKANGSEGTIALEDITDNPNIRVLLIKSADQLDMVTQTAWVLQTMGGEKVMDLPEKTPFKLSEKNGIITVEAGGKKEQLPELVLEAAAPHGVIEIKKVPYGVGWWWENAEDRTYEGRLEIRISHKGGMEVVDEMKMEDYLTGVVPSEIGSTSPQEALRAQAVAARSEALMALVTGKYAGPNNDIGSDVESQAFTGNVKRTPASDEAVSATRGLALIHEDKFLAAYYASCCGGHTEDIRNVWSSRSEEKGYWNTAVFDSEKKHKFDLTKEDDLRLWLKEDPDVYCNPNKHKVPAWASKNFRWERVFTADEVTTSVAAKKDIGRIIAVKAIKRGPSGRMIEVEFIGEKGVYKTGPELTIRQIFDPPLKSAAFVVDTEGPSNRPEKFIFRGGGWGHGVGMCQTGAIVMANEGKTFREILAHYYPAAKIKSIY